MKKNLKINIPQIRIDLSSSFNMTGDKSIIFITAFYFVVFCSIVLKFQDSNLIGDEKRYLEHAHCILNFQFTPDDAYMWLWNGPGYPLILAPIVVFFEDPILVARLLNAFLLAFSLYIFYKALRFVVSKNIAVVAFLAYANYFLIWKNLPLVMTEIPTLFFICLIIYFLLKPKNGKYDMIIIAFLFAYTAMIKIAFGYIITASLVFFILYYFLIKRDSYFLQISKMFAISLLFCLPWLGYTFSKSGKVFYWAASGGMNLYWISNPTIGEYGEYMDSSFQSAAGVPESKIGYEKSHGEEIRRIERDFKYGERDDEFKRVALANIKNHPKAFLKNTICNIGRFFFNYPYSYYKQRPSTLINVFINGPILGFIFISLVILLFNLRSTPSPLIVLLTVMFAYMAINFPLSVLIRMFYILIPILFAWFAITAQNLHYNNNSSQRISTD